MNESLSFSFHPVRRLILPVTHTALTISFELSPCYWMNVIQPFDADLSIISLPEGTQILSEQMRDTTGKLIAIPLGGKGHIC